eukprot:TRINITY_DN3325_c0_g1_i1.p1 TRINITY_DN3325_c0_g1~~TRINITY_DN3325_c0_g1_i1.p1  ORF type:complete len:587 (+),score=82.17 TRINITY_DN3325_c0_g1_i1:1239-2999(+)
MVDKPAPQGLEKVVEGKAAVLFPAARSGVFYNKAQVVNRDLSILVLRVFAEILPLSKRKVQRDKLHVLEALGASGLRSIRYWKEIPGVAHITCNDLSTKAHDSIQENLAFNDVPIVTEFGGAGVKPNCDDAVTLMMGSRGGAPGACPRFNVIDLDPYGSAVPFVDAAVQSVDEGGLLCVTCTDSAVLCGTYPETCFAKYNAITARAKYCHESGVRILLGFLEKACNRHGRHIVPLLSLSIDFYVRVFVRVFTSKAEVKYAISKMSHVQQCSDCCNFHIQPVGLVLPSTRSHGKGSSHHKEDDGAEAEDVTEEMEDTKAPLEQPVEQPQAPPAGASEPVTLESVAKATGKTGRNSNGMRFLTGRLIAPQHCEVCGGSFQQAGPIYSSPIHNVPFVTLLLKHLEAHKSEFKAYTRIRGLLSLARDELQIPLFYDMPALVSSLKTRTPPIVKFRSALANLGHQVSSAHCDSDAIKTTAPGSVVYEVLKSWHSTVVRSMPECPPEPAPESLAARIFSRTAEIKADFTANRSFDYSKKQTGVTRFVHNEPFWGPMRAAPIVRGDASTDAPPTKRPRGEGDEPEAQESTTVS